MLQCSPERTQGMDGVRNHDQLHSGPQDQVLFILYYGLGSQLSDKPAAVEGCLFPAVEKGELPQQVFETV